MRLPKPRVLPPIVPAPGLAGIAMLLVFFFLLVTRFGADREPVDLPPAPGLHEAPPGSATLLVERRVGPLAGETLTWKFSDGRGAVSTLPGPEGLFFEVSRLVDEDPERTFLLRVDGDVRFGAVDDALENLRRAGARNVVFAAAQAAAR